MGIIRILSADQVDEVLAEADLQSVLTDAMIHLSNGSTGAPKAVASTPFGELHANPGYLDGVGLAAKVVSRFPNHDRSNNDSANNDRSNNDRSNNDSADTSPGHLALLDPEDGSLLSIMAADGITVKRTAVTAALAADVLARPDATVLTIVGAGPQAIGHAMAFAKIRPWREVRVHNRTQPSAVVVAGAAREAGAAKAEVADSLELSVQGADVVVLCTHADGPLIDPQMVKPGMHISSIGSAGELPVELLDRDDAIVVVEWRGAIVEPPPVGAHELQGYEVARAIELGTILSEQSTFDRPEGAVTVYKSTGHIVQDVAVARLVYDLASELKIGTDVRL